MLDTIHTDYIYEVLRKDGVSHIRIDGLCPIYEGLEGDPGMLGSLWWLSDDSRLVIHYLVKGDRYQGLQRSLISDLKEGLDKFGVVCRSDGHSDVIPRRF